MVSNMDLRAAPKASVSDSKATMGKVAVTSLVLRSVDLRPP